MRRIVALLFTAIIAASVCSAFAASSAFETESGYDFYGSTLYEDEFGSEYNYGGPNAADFRDSSLLPGLITLTLEMAVPGADGIQYGLQPDGTQPYPYPEYDNSFVSTAFTPAEDLIRSDGSIGTLEIPSLSIKMKVFEGTASKSMSKGLGHFDETSGWLGNIGISGHNRNAQYTIGEIKDLRAGDIIKYTTISGTKTYAVTFSGTIASTDWSYLSPTSDNRITLITCLADRPSLRVCVQGIEVIG